MAKSSETKTTLRGVLYVPSEVNEDLSPIIFLHPMLASKEVWEDLPQKVAEATKRRVYVYDAGNHGANDHSENFTFDQTVDDLFQFMKEMNIEKAILVGHGMGGITAIRATLMEPAKVEKLISVDMSVKPLDGEVIKRTIHFVEKWVKAVENLDPEKTPMDKVHTESVEELYRNLDEFEQLPHEKAAYLKARFLYNRTPGGKYKLQFNDAAILGFLSKYETLEKVFFDKLEESKKKCEVPASFIYASDSHYKIKSKRNEIEEYFKNAEFVEITGKAHFIFVEEPDKFKEELIKCLQN